MATVLFYIEASDLPIDNELRSRLKNYGNQQMCEVWIKSVKYSRFEV